MPDLLFHDGPIYTLDPQQPKAEALIVRDGMIAAVGSAREIREQLRPGYQSISLRGRALLPGLTDAHIHLLWTGLGRHQIDLDGVESLDAALDQIRQHVAKTPDGWIRGHGWNHALWSNRWPTAQELDRVSEGRPAILSRKDGHSVWLNSRALELAGIDERTPDTDGGVIQRDHAGRPTGVLLENAMDLAWSVVPDPSPLDNQRALETIIRECNAHGLTSLHLPEGPESLSAVQALRARDTLDARILFHIPYRLLDEYIALGVRSGLGDDLVRIGGVKIFSDGSLGSCTCHMLSPFVGTQTCGVPTIPDEDLFSAVERANGNGIAVTIHAIGDSANRTVLNAIERTQHTLATREGYVAPRLPNRIEHAQHLDPADVPRFAALNVIASMQPIHATSDMEIAERLLGGERSRWSYAWRPLAQSGAMLALGSDAPVETLDPWGGVHAAVTRKRQNGQPVNGWNRDLALDLMATLRGYSVGPAVASGEADRKGWLAPGMYADMIVLTADPFTADPDDLWRMQVEQTFVGGRSVWERS